MRAHSERGRRAFRYSAVSVISVIVGQLSLFILFTGLHWTARSANVLSCVIAAIPSYYLNRRWTWAKAGPSHLLKEVLPFWMVALAGLVLSSWAADLGEVVALRTTAHRSTQGIIVGAASMAAFGALWVAKFLFLNRVLFASKR